MAALARLILIPAFVLAFAVFVAARLIKHAAPGIKAARVGRSMEAAPAALEEARHVRLGRLHPVPPGVQALPVQRLGEDPPRGTDLATLWAEYKQLNGRCLPGRGATFVQGRNFDRLLLVHALYSLAVVGVLTLGLALWPELPGWLPVPEPGASPLVPLPD